MAAGTPTYPVTTIAKLLKISERRVQQLTKEGVIPKSERGRYELAAAVQGYVTFLQDRLAGNPDASEGGVDYQAQRTRKISAEAALAEIELAKARDEVVELAIVARVVGDALSACRSRLMAIGATVAPRLELADGTAARKEMIDAAVYEALDEISGPTFKFVSDPRDSVPGDDADGAGGADAPAAEADAEPVGGRKSVSVRRGKRRTGALANQPG